MSEPTVIECSWPTEHEQTLVATGGLCHPVRPFLRFTVNTSGFQVGVITAEECRAWANLKS